MNNSVTMADRLRAVEDRLAIEALAALYSDALIQKDEDEFRKLWASDRPVWHIGNPYNMRAEGIDAIMKQVHDLMAQQQYFMQMTHSGVITVTGDRATTRFVMRERARGDNLYYENLAVYEDHLVREPEGWRFALRHYKYRYLDKSPFSGDFFPIENA